MTRLEGLKLLVDARRRTISHKYAEALRHHDRIQVHTAEVGDASWDQGTGRSRNQVSQVT